MTAELYAKAVILDVRLRPASKLGRNHTSASGFWTYLAIFLGVIYVHTSTNGSPVVVIVDSILV